MVNKKNFEKDFVEKENIRNLPNFLTLCRVIAALVIFYLIFADFHIFYIIAVFVIGMITDFFDGFTARKFNLVTEFGRKFDVLADRFILIGTVLSLAIKFSIIGILTKAHLFQMFFMLSREIISFPVAIFSLFFRTGIPKVRLIGKITTFSQSIAIPLVFLSIFYPFFNFSWFFALIAGFFGLISGFYYFIDTKESIVRKIHSVRFFQ